jgi:hypothetical protein
VHGSTAGFAMKRPMAGDHRLDQRAPCPALLTQDLRPRSMAAAANKTSTVGTTEFTLPFVGKVWQRVCDEFAAREIELNVQHVRTKDSFARLDAREIDLLCGGLITRAGRAAS